MKLRIIRESVDVKYNKTVCESAVCVSVRFMLRVPPLSVPVLYNEPTGV